MTIGDSLILKSGANCLNFLRLVLATMVIVSHSITIGGFGREDILGNQSLGSVAVDGFFGISGFLICASGLRHIGTRRSWPGLLHYLWDRVLRIFPAFWVCLIVTVGVFGVIGWAAVHPSLSGYLSHSHGPEHYLRANFALVINTFQISGTPSHVPYPGVWDGSLWTLEWEFLCYLGIALLAIVGLLARSTVVLGIAIALWIADIGIFIHPMLVHHTKFEGAARFAPIFLVGAVLYLYRDRVPDSGRLALGLLALACLGLTVGKPDSMNFDWLTGPALVYPVLWLGAHLPFRRVGAHNDISYGMYIYGFPIGQLLALAGVEHWGYAPFATLSIICTVPLAAASWWGLEKWALRARRWHPLIQHRPVRVAEQLG